MRFQLYIQGIALLQLLIHIHASTIPTNALAVPANSSPLALGFPTSKRSWPDHRHRFFVVTQAVGLTFLVRFQVLELVQQSSSLSTLAANDLVHFYKAAFAVAGASWALDQPKTVRRARMNGIILLFWSETPIAWDFMKAFFEHIIDRTHGGLVGGYDVTCVAEVGNAVVHVSLSLPIRENGHSARAAKRVTE